MKLRLLFNVSFNPLDYAQGPDFEALSDLHQRGLLEIPLKLQVLRRRSAWAITLPIGAYVNDFRTGIVSYEQDHARFEEILRQIRASFGYRPWQTKRALITRENQLFYHEKMIDIVRKHVEQPAFFNAVFAYLQAIKRDPSLVKGKDPDRFVPLERRPVVNGHRARGPGWTPEEDQILRQWFGIRTVGANAGHHAKLTEAEWQRVLELLGGRRTRGSIRQRISTLNLETLKRFCVNGFVPRDRVREYMELALGEQPRYPRVSVALRRTA